MEMIKILQSIEMINKRLSNIENNIAKIDEKIEFSTSLMRNQLIKVKNNEDLDDQNILLGRPYNELSPQQAQKIYKNSNASFILVDVSSESFTPKAKLEGIVKIPLEELANRYNEIFSKTIPILVISEKGIRSIKACELLVKKGYFNINNIAGGYDFWDNEKSDFAHP